MIFSEYIGLNLCDDWLKCYIRTLGKCHYQSIVCKVIISWEITVYKHITLRIFAPLVGAKARSGGENMQCVFLPHYCGFFAPFKLKEMCYENTLMWNLVSVPNYQNYCNLNSEVSSANVKLLTKLISTVKYNL